MENGTPKLRTLAPALPLPSVPKPPADVPDLTTNAVLTKAVEKGDIAELLRLVGPPRPIEPPILVGPGNPLDPSPRRRKHFTPHVSQPAADQENQTGASPSFVQPAPPPIAIKTEGISKQGASSLRRGRYHKYAKDMKGKEFGLLDVNGKYTTLHSETT